ncbi:hypothetical protein BGX33_011003, partial [Mortierella sp. NVP41]
FETPLYNCLVFGLCEGSPVDKLAKGPLPDDQVRKHGKVIVAGCSSLHSQNVAHCDIKPGNMLLTEAGRVLVADFGLVKQTRGQKFKLNQAYEGYHSPEVEKKQVCTFKTDVWSFESLFLAMLTAEPSRANEQSQCCTATKPGRRPDFETLGNDPFFSLTAPSFSSALTPEGSPRSGRKKQKRKDNGKKTEEEVAKEELIRTMIDDEEAESLLHLAGNPTGGIVIKEAAKEPKDTKDQETEEFENLPWLHTEAPPVEYFDAYFDARVLLNAQTAASSASSSSSAAAADSTTTTTMREKDEKDNKDDERGKSDDKAADDETDGKKK